MLQVFYGMARKDLRLPEVVTEMNRRLKEYAPAGIYLAAALVAVHPGEGGVEIWNGGIPGGLWLHDGRVDAAQSLASRHLPLGVLDEAAFDSRCAAADSGRGGRILFFSDGLLDARNRHGEAFGQARLLARLDAAAPDEGFARALQAVEDHLAGRPAHDDISLMMIALDPR
jgi:serine phosphatase RsbU (regulator of sigma subunit)